MKKRPTPTHKLLGIPLIIWILQLWYVAFALGLFAAISIKFHQQIHQLAFQFFYVLIMVTINVTWRVNIKKPKPGWF